MFGLRSARIADVQAIWSSSSQSVRLVRASSPRAHRRLAQELSLVAAGDVDLSFVAYHAEERDDGRHYHIAMGVDSDRALSYAILERRSNVWFGTWEQFESEGIPLVPDAEPVWSVGFAWVSRANRRKGWMRRTLTAAANYLGLPLDRFAWHTPFTADGKALARHINPTGVLVGK
jgi:hypothetical protein